MQGFVLIFIVDVWSFQLRETVTLNNVLHYSRLHAASQYNINVSMKNVDIKFLILCLILFCS